MDDDVGLVRPWGEHPGSAVGRAVVDDDELLVERQGVDLLQDLVDELLLVVDRDQERDPHDVSSLRTASACPWSTTAPATMYGKKLTACRTRAYESAADFSIPYAFSAIRAAASKTPTAAGDEGRTSPSPTATITSPPASGERPRSKPFISTQADSASRIQDAAVSVMATSASVGS